MRGRVEIRPGQWYAWYGPALLITDQRGECGSAGRPDLTGLYFREARCLSRLRLEVNAIRPRLCATGSTTQEQLAFAYVHPEGGPGLVDAR